MPVVEPAPVLELAPNVESAPEYGTQFFRKVYLPLLEQETLYRNRKRAKFGV